MLRALLTQLEEAPSESPQYPSGIAPNSSRLGDGEGDELSLEVKHDAYQASGRKGSMGNDQSVAAAQPEPTEDVLVVAADKAWPLYQTTVHSYICETGRAKKPFRYLAFYYDGVVQPVIARVRDQYDRVPWTTSEMNRLLASDDPRDQLLSEVMRKAFEVSWARETQGLDEVRELKVFILSGSDESDTEILDRSVPMGHPNGHPNPIQGHKYTTLEKLRSASSTDDL